MMTNDNREWAHCPTGTLNRLARQSTVASRSNALRPYGVGAVIGVMLAAMLFGISLLSGGSGIGNGVVPAVVPQSLACADVIPMLGNYHRGELEVALAEQIKVHLEKCPSCAQRYQEEFGAAVQAARHGSRAELLQLLASR